MDITNYLLEANLGLVFFSVVYFLLLHRETQFNVKRAYLLGAMLASVVFPFIEFQFPVPQTSNENFVTEVYFPEMIIGANPNHPSAVGTPSIFNFWNIAVWTYTIITGLVLTRFVVQLGKLLFYLRAQSFYQDGRFKIAESAHAMATFSFFHYIVVGNTGQLEKDEKEKIVQHEKTHAKNFHSFDIILSELFIIAFWFNPIVYTLKNQLITIHEFEADQQSLEQTDVSTYCNLLARVSLLTAGFSFVNHFNDSLTLKRIAMINTEKTNIRKWKYIMLIPVLSAGLLAASAQGQLIRVDGTITEELNLPQEVKMLLETVENYTLPDGTLRTKLTDLEDWRSKNPDAKFYIEKVDYRKKVEGLSPSESIKVSEQNAIEQYKKEYNKAEGFLSYTAVVNKPGADYDYEYAYIIRAITDHKTKIILHPNYGDRIDLPYYWGGPEAMNAYLAKKIKYPATAAVNKIEGSVLISFVVDTGGNVTAPYVYKGIGYGCDEEALAAVAGLKWRPGMQNGQLADVRCLVPVIFKIPQVEEQK